MDLWKKSEKERMRKKRYNEHKGKNMRRQESLCFMGIEQRVDIYTADKNLISPLLLLAIAMEILTVKSLVYTFAAASVAAAVQFQHLSKTSQFDSKQKIDF